MARNRRDQEKNEVAELALLLPLSPAIKDQLDRVTIIKMTTEYFALKNLIYGQSGEDEEQAMDDQNRVFQSFREQNPFRSEILASFTLNTLQTLNGFILVLDLNGKIIYVSETAAVHFGISQVEMIGTSMLDLLHKDDVQDVKYTLAIGYEKHQITIDNHETRFTSRMRCSLAKRNAGITNCGYKTIHFFGRMMPENRCRFIGYGHPMVPYGLNEMRLNLSQFMFRATLSLQLVFIDSKIFKLLGYGPGNLLDKSYYQIVHADDAEELKCIHRTEKNQAITGYYRLLAHNGGMVWAITKFTTVQVLRSPLNQCIVGITSVVGFENNEVVDLIQQTTISETNQSVLGEYSHNFYVPFAVTDRSHDLS